MSEEISIKEDTGEKLPINPETITAGQLLNIRELNTEQMEELQHSIEANGGTVYLLIHPYYDVRLLFLRQPELDTPEKMSWFKEILDGNDRIVKTPNGSMPVFIMEENEESTGAVSKLKEKIKTLGISKTIYLVETKRADSKPFELNWENFIKFFKKIGVKKCVVGGMFLKILNPSSPASNVFIDPEAVRNLDDGVFFRYCVGRAIAELQKDFKIEVSKFTFPAGREEYQKFKDKRAKESE